MRAMRDEEGAQFSLCVYTGRVLLVYCCLCTEFLRVVVTTDVAAAHAFIASAPATLKYPLESVVEMFRRHFERIIPVYEAKPSEV